ncbi:mechanosensitive ion channel domain-containing protein [Rhodovarius sp.]|uniref:mechanosensitive ion channel domain-containing protein n=2 Tax=Rhodovarius sp. TaxID=2972673 RepID=UPI00333FB799
MSVMLWMLAVMLPGMAQLPSSPPASAALAAAAPSATAPAGPDLQHLLETLRNDGRRAELIALLEAVATAQRQGAPNAPPNAAQTPAEAPILGATTERISAAIGAMAAEIESATDLEGILAWLSGMVSDETLQAMVLELGWKLLLVFGLGLLTERLSKRLLRHWAAMLDMRAPPEGAQNAMLRRAPYIAARLLLDLAPVLAFCLVARVIIPQLPGWPSQRVIIWTVANAYIVARGVMVVVRLLFSPASNHLRLLPCADETAAYVTVWMQRIALVSVSAYAASEFALLLAMPLSVQNGMLRVGSLLVSVLAAIMVLQNRQPVARFLAAPPLAEGEVPDRGRAMLRRLRDMLADAWHVLAILWVLALWASWAMALNHGVDRLLQASGLTVVVVVVAKLADEAMRRLLDGAFSISADFASRFPGLEARANRYLPGLKGLVGVLIALVTVVVLLEVWGLGAFSWFRYGRGGARLLGSVMSISLTLLLALLVWEAANAAIARHLAQLSANAATARSARVRTLLPMLRTVLGIVVTIFITLNVLAEIGVNVAPLLAGAGVIGLAVGFGSQTLVRDVITGVFLLFEDSVAVGDVVTLGGLSGTVEQLSIRSIRLRAVNGDVHIIPFSAVTTVTNQTRDYGYAVIDLVVDYDADTDLVASALSEVGTVMRADDAWSGSIMAAIEVMGVERMSDMGVVVRARMKTEPARRWAVSRELNRRVKLRCGELGIMISPPGKVVQVPPPPPAV